MDDAREARGHLLPVVLAGLVLIGACSGPQGDTEGPTRTPASPADPEAYAGELAALTNETRSDEGLDVFASSECARDAALGRAAALVGQEELTHAPLAPIIAACAPQTTAAENLANSTAQPIDVVEAWLESPGHRANILDPDLTEIGVACVPDRDNLLCSQVFLGP